MAVDVGTKNINTHVINCVCSIQCHVAIINQVTRVGLDLNSI